MVPKPTPPTSGKYAANDRVLCYHGAMLYEAKILDLAHDDGVTRYFVHYQGWNNRWDEWVLDDRLLEPNDENLKKVQELATKHGPGGGKGGGGGGSSRRSLAGAGDQMGSSGPPSKPRTPGTGGKSKSSQGTESSGPSTPYDGSSKMAHDNIGTGLELESRASTPSIDGGASVTSSTTSHLNMSQPRSGKRTAAGKAKSGGGGSVETPHGAGGESFDNATATEPKRKRGRHLASSQPSVTPPSGGNAAASAYPEPGVESYEQFRGRQEVPVKMPEELKQLLVDDWDLIMRQCKLCKVPATNTVNDILDDYVKSKLSQQKGMAPSKASRWKENANGFRQYFNAMLGQQLLYKFERPQYNDFLAQQKTVAGFQGNSDGQANQGRVQVSAFYGVPHFLRFFVRFGHMLAYTDFDQKTMDMVMSATEDLLKFITRRAARYFRLEDYETATPEYQRKAYAN